MQRHTTHNKMALLIGGTRLWWQQHALLKQQKLLAEFFLGGEGRQS